MKTLMCVVLVCTLNVGCTTQLMLMDDSDCGLGYYTGSDGQCLYQHSSVIFYLTTSANSVDPDIVQAVYDAADEWNRHLANIQITISNTYVNREVDTDGVNIIHFEQDNWDSSRANVQGTAYLAASTEIIESDIAFNLVNFVLSKDAEPYKVHAKALALHELGHALGLVHATSYYGRVMSPTLPYNYNRGCLFEDDQEKIGNIYQLKSPVPNVLDPNSYYGWGVADGPC